MIGKENNLAGVGRQNVLKSQSVIGLSSREVEKKQNENDNNKIAAVLAGGCLWFFGVPLVGELLFSIVPPEYRGVYTLGMLILWLGPYLSLLA